MVTESEFRTAVQLIRSNKNVLNSKFVVSCYYLEHNQNYQARQYLGDIIEKVDRSQAVKLVSLMISKMPSSQDNGNQRRSYNSQFNSEDISHFISLLQILNKQEVKGTDDWLLASGENYKNRLLQLVDTDFHALKKLGDMHYYGKFNVPKDFDAALHCLLRAYQLRRDSNIANFIGCAYDEQKNYTQALDYFKKAGEARSPAGCFNVARYNHYGKNTVIPVNLSEAERYYKIACRINGSYPKAEYGLGKVYQEYHKKKY